ncbi:hypothetical protein EVG20_g825 [Dentipellis fragilis]|uniref:Uncharacterized protein n=1 Tax=Dentipellis fragilis TaxID=205917 RepID=A0A4Y9ZC81_9AGAM|nr:hypothetical protein EVG20_g825 [Dentipellis fragilis]
MCFLLDPAAPQACARFYLCISTDQRVLIEASAGRSHCTNADINAMTLPRSRLILARLAAKLAFANDFDIYLGDELTRISTKLDAIQLVNDLVATRHWTIQSLSQHRDSHLQHLPNSVMSGSPPNANGVTVQKYIEYEVRIEELRTWVQQNVPANDHQTMHEQAIAEFNRRRDVYPSEQQVRGDSELANFWRKTYRASTHLVTYSFAIQCMMMHELDQVDPEWIAAADTQVRQALIEKGLAKLPQARSPHTSDAHLHQWLGKTLSVNRNGTAQQYRVVDAVSSAMRGSYFVLQDPQNEADSFEVPNDLFEEMVLQYTQDA